MFEGEIWAKAGSKRTTVGGNHGGRLIVAVSAPASEGAANAAIRAALAAAFEVRVRDVEVVRGVTARAKRVALDGDRTQLQERWRELLDG